MAVKESMFRQVANFINENDVDWFLKHMAVDVDDQSKTITIVIDNVNEQEYKWIKEEIKGEFYTQNTQ